MQLGSAVEKEPLLQSVFNEDQPRFSPDERWLTYESEESGRCGACVRSICPGRHGRAEKHQISREGGFQPVGRPDGRELFVLSPHRKLMAVDVAVNGNGFTSRPHWCKRSRQKQLCELLSLAAPCVLLASRAGRLQTLHSVFERPDAFKCARTDALEQLGILAGITY